MHCVVRVEVRNLSFSTRVTRGCTLRTLMALLLLPLACLLLQLALLLPSLWFLPLLLIVLLPLGLKLLSNISSTAVAIYCAEGHGCPDPHRSCSLTSGPDCGDFPKGFQSNPARRDTPRVGHIHVCVYACMYVFSRM